LVFDLKSLNSLACLKEQSEGFNSHQMYHVFELNYLLN
jgi:hypothetical protein